MQYPAQDRSRDDGKVNLTNEMLAKQKIMTVLVGMGKLSFHDEDTASHKPPAHLMSSGDKHPPQLCH
jgi:hypothetical protein